MGPRVPIYGMGTNIKVSWDTKNNVIQDFARFYRRFAFFFWSFCPVRPSPTNGFKLGCQFFFFLAYVTFWHFWCDTKTSLSNLFFQFLKEKCLKLLFFKNQKSLFWRKGNLACGVVAFNFLDKRLPSNPRVFGIRKDNLVEWLSAVKTIIISST